MTEPGDTNMAVTIEDLPAELLREIVSHLRSPDIVEAGLDRVDWREGRRDSRSGDLQAIKSARLTCRGFNEAASQFLLPCIPVSVDQRSLRRVESIVESPHVASGVRCVSVDLSCYPREAVTSLEAFMERQMYHIKDEACYLNHGERFGYRRHCHTLHGDGDCITHEDNVEADTEKHICRILASWENKPDQEAGPSRSTSPDYLGALYDAYHVSKAAYGEQTELLSSGLFSKTLASLISRLPKFRELRLYDEPTSPRSKYDPLETFSLHELFMSFLSAPYNFFAAEDDLALEAMEIPTASILRDLPIAIHEAGATIRHLRIARFPTLPKNVSLFDVAGCEEHFCTALHSLERFQLFIHRRRPRRRDDDVGLFDGVDEATDRYLAAVVSTPSLRELDLSFVPYHSVAEWYPLSGLISALTSEQITRLSLSHVSMRQCDFEGMCSRVSSAAELVRLYALSLSEGNWTPGVEVLRAKTAARCAEGTCLVQANRFDGGEYKGKGQYVSMKNWRRAIAGNYTGPPLVLPRAHQSGTRQKDILTARAVDMLQSALSSSR